ncbi:hypothetical protein [Allosphingosinicella deserti]|uniref:hypothetical protein n=1 Tax=Allosphingosinicella deserti TaxID=2116704 RepID=UPI001304A80C|nr:hypothetical protein [Sphingomonas deserti]
MGGSVTVGSSLIWATLSTVMEGRAGGPGHRDSRCAAPADQRPCRHQQRQSRAQRTMYIHQGGNSMTGSAGRQTIRKRDHADFLDAIGRKTSFGYVLVNR